MAKFYETGSMAGIQAEHSKRLRMLLVVLETAVTILDMAIAGFQLHQLKGKSADRWSIRVSGNWRLTFEFYDGHAYVIDYEDYH